MPMRELSVAGPVTVALLSTLLLSGAAQAEGPNRVEMLANACTTCHGADGGGSLKVPKLREELEIKDFVLTMQGFKTGKEKATVMDRIAEAFNDEEIKLLADYFAGVKE